MTNEIKEILEDLKTFDENSGCPYELSGKDCKLLLDYITNLQKENERLNNIIDELEKWLNEYYESNRKWYNFELSNHDKKYYEETYRNTEFMIVKFLKQLKELKEGEDKE